MADMLGNMADHMKTVMSGVLAEGRKIQEGPMGTRKRSKAERTRMFNRLAKLDKPERQALMEEMATDAGHEHGEKEMCDLCQFVADQMNMKEVLG